MPYPVFLAGQRLLASRLLAMQPRHVVKPVQEQVTASTTFQDDDHLSLSLEANASYDVLFVLYPTGNSSTFATTTDRGQFKTRWTTPTGSTGLKSCVGIVGPNRDSSLMRSSCHGFGTSVSYDLHNTTQAPAMVEQGVVTTGPTAGLLTLQWAQVNSGPTPTTLLASSYLRATRVS